MKKINKVIKAAVYAFMLGVVLTVTAFADDPVYESSS